MNAVAENKTHQSLALFSTRRKLFFVFNLIRRNDVWIEMEIGLHTTPENRRFDKTKAPEFE
jgi:hypothetical protein